MIENHEKFESHRPDMSAPYVFYLGYVYKVGFLVQRER